MKGKAVDSKLGGIGPSERTPLWNRGALHFTVWGALFYTKYGSQIKQENPLNLSI